MIVPGHENIFRTSTKFSNTATEVVIIRDRVLDTVIKKAATLDRVKAFRPPPITIRAARIPVPWIPPTCSSRRCGSEERQVGANYRATSTITEDAVLRGNLPDLRQVSI